MRFRWMAVAAVLSTAVQGFAFESVSQVNRAQDAAIAELQQIAPGLRTIKTGGVIERLYGVPFGGGYTAEDAVKTFAATHEAALGLGDAKLRFDRMQPIGRDGRFNAGYFDVTLNGVKVDGMNVTLLTRNEIANPVVLAVIGARPFVGTVGRARLTAQQAMNSVARRHPEYEKVHSAELVVWANEDRHRLAYKMFGEGFVMEQPYHNYIYVDAQTGAILEKRSAIYHLDVVGTVRGWATPGVFPDTASNPEVLTPLPYLRVTSGTTNVFADVNGFFTIPNPGISPITVTHGISGRWSNVVPAQGTPITGSLNVPPPGPALFELNTIRDQFTTAQVNAYLHTSLVHDYIKAQNPAYPGIDISITTNVNQASTCNANFQSANLSINFFNEGGGCPNTAYISVIYHEYGHFVINRAGTNQGAYGEGMSDTIAALMMNDSRLGMDFRGPGTGPLRNAVNTIRHPDNASSPIHTYGMVISGSFWETLLELDNTIGRAAGLALMQEYSVNSILVRPPQISPAITVDVLTLDDNDGNLSNGTPRYTEIAAGFGEKGLTAPAVDFLNFAPISLPGTFIQASPNDVHLGFNLQVQDNAGVLDPNSVVLNYRLNGGPWQTSPLVEYADPGFMAGGIDQPVSGTSIDWYISARDTQNRTQNYPRAGASAPFSSVVARQLWTVLEDTFETNQGWNVTNTSVTSGGWERGSPFGTVNGTAPLAPSTDSGDAGAQCFVTQIGTAGAAAGTHDLDGGPTTLTSPTLITFGNDCIISYSRWFNTFNGVADVMNIQVSTNGGATWTTVDTASGTGTTWVNRTFRLGQFVAPGANLILRAVVQDQPNDSVTEAGFDNVRVQRIVP